VKLLWEWWIQMWPNLASSAVVGAIAFPIHHKKIKKHIEKLRDK